MSRAVVLVVALLACAAVAVRADGEVKETSLIGAGIVNATNAGYWEFTPFGFGNTLCLLTGGSCMAVCNDYQACIGQLPLTFNSYQTNSIAFSFPSTGFYDLGKAAVLGYQNSVPSEWGTNNIITDISRQNPTSPTPSGPPGIWVNGPKASNRWWKQLPYTGPQYLTITEASSGHLFLAQVNSQYYLKFEITSATLNPTSGYLTVGIQWFLF